MTPLPDQFHLYLAYGSAGRETLEKHADEDPVSLLVAVPFWPDFVKHRHKFNVRRVMLDSGAFTAWNSGKEIGYEYWRDVARSSGADEIISLDAIGDAKKTRENWERALSDGLVTWPTYHQFEPVSYLRHYAANSPKMCLGGVAKGAKGKVAWFRSCMSVAYPARVHALGAASEEAVLCAPFHSSDASSWCFAPAAMGQWAGYTGKQMRIATRSVRDYWVEVKEHLRRERLARARFGHLVKQLGTKQ